MPGQCARPTRLFFFDIKKSEILIQRYAIHSVRIYLATLYEQRLTVSCGGHFASNAFDCLPYIAKEIYAIKTHTQSPN